MNTSEKKALIVEQIKYKSDLLPFGYDFRVDYNDFSEHLTFYEFGAIIHKLCYEHKAIEILAGPEDEHYYDNNFEGELRRICMTKSIRNTGNHRTNYKIKSTSYRKQTKNTILLVVTC